MESLRASLTRRRLLVLSAGAGASLLLVARFKVLASRAVRPF